MKQTIQTLVIIFLVIIILSVLLVPVIRQNPLEKFTDPLMNNGIVADLAYRENTDLNYAAARWGLKISPEQNRKTNQVAPILNPGSYRPVVGGGELWGSAPAAQNTTRIPDKWSTPESYNHRIAGII